MSPNNISKLKITVLKMPFNFKPFPNNSEHLKNVNHTVLKSPAGYIMAENESYKREEKRRNVMACKYFFFSIQLCTHHIWHIQDSKYNTCISSKMSEWLIQKGH